MTRKSLIPIVFVSFILMLCASGCIIPDEQQIRQFSDDTKLLSARVDDYQVIVNDVKHLLIEDKVISQQTAERIDKIGEEIDRVQPHIDSIADAVRDADYVTGDDVGNLFKGAKAGVGASAPVNPYAAAIMGLLTLAEVVTLTLLKKKSGEVKVVTTRLDKTNEGIAKFQGLSDPSTASALHDTIKGKVTNI